jgi:L-ascorbate metabolism protein UlaG (beta-lactamase superfamily)
MVMIVMPMSIKRLSHWSWFQVKVGNQTLQIDPAFIRTRGKPPSELLTKADVILFTHDHNDHCRADTLPNICDGHTRIFAPASCARKIDYDFTVVRAGSISRLNGITIRAVEAYNLHENHPDKVWHPQGKGVGYLLTVGGRTVYHAGDTDFIPEMRSLGPVDVALLPIGGTFTMTPDEAVLAALAIRPGAVVPMHARDEDPAAFKEKMAGAAPEIKVVLMKAGDELTL